MLTCKVGKTIINCFDGKYDKSTLKNWSDKNILKCPGCGDDYEYCHGDISPPYFRHKNKECEGYYSEPETEEHRYGKQLLYKWILEQDGIKNCKLEAWIPETKQRPDIYFEIDGNKFVIEFQCTPIATEFLKRRELYRLADIKDIWILGKDKYNIEFYTYTADHASRFKNIEKYIKIYLDVRKSRVAIGNDVIKNKLPYNDYSLKEYYIFPLKEMIINLEEYSICPTDSNIQYFINIDTDIHIRKN